MGDATSQHGTALRDSFVRLTVSAGVFSRRVYPRASFESCGFLVFSRLKSISFFAVSREEFMLEGSNMVQIEDFFSSPYGWEGILQAIKNKLFWHTYKVSV